MPPNKRLLQAASAAPLPSSTQRSPSVDQDGRPHRRQKLSPPDDVESPEQAAFGKAKRAELELARQQIRTQQERILLLEQQLHTQSEAAQQAARAATHNQALLLNKLALLMSEDELHAWLLGTGMLEPEAGEEHAPRRQCKRRWEEWETPPAEEQHTRRRRRLFGLI